MVKRLPLAARRIFVWLFVPVALMGVIAVLPSTTLEPAQLGMCVDISNADQETVNREFDLMAAMKVTWIRADFDWSVAHARLAAQLRGVGFVEQRQ